MFGLVGFPQQQSLGDSGSGGPREGAGTRVSAPDQEVPTRALKARSAGASWVAGTFFILHLRLCHCVPKTETQGKEAL